ncbi:hypothetical protein AYO44_09610 [Planctomycetaceae bacterium SCGC AG-212-F19]|nr:hypothetical protein AYO44_09610 [Planctomycetaceae bacterium SCGC AG-212-F19]
MRCLWFVLLACGVCGCAGRPESGGSAAMSADYASARASFQTKLLRRGPSPEPASALHFSKLQRPRDVDEVEYVSGDLRLKAWTQAPPAAGGKPLPAVLFLHGGWGFDEGDWQHTRAFREAGYIVLAPMLRGENGCPGHFTMFYDEVDDVIAAGEHLAKLANVDPERVYLAGYSAGGTLAMFGAMRSKRFRAVAALDGSPDRRRFIQGREQEVPFDLRDANELRMRSPGEFPGSFQCPTRLYCSQDEGGYLDATRRLAQAAKSQGLDVEMVSVPGDHGTFREPATKKAIAFFQQR